MLWLIMLACGSEPETGAAGPEPLVLPDDPAENGVPVGVRTIEIAGGPLIEVWYPAPDAVAEEDGEVADMGQFIPDSVTEVLGEVVLPEVATIGVRDAALRMPESPYPVIVFSHGFGGFRLQSVDLTTHWASRGYVVVAADHPGRMLGDVLPCVFSPPLDGCGIGGDDPAVADVADILDWLEGAAVEGWLASAIDLDAIALTGHSAGAGTTVSVGESDTRITAMVPMAYPGSPDRDVPRLLMGGTCDAYADGLTMDLAWSQTPGAELVLLEGAGHLAFSDLCTLELGAMAETYLIGRDDVSQVWLDQLLGLATDGCPEATPPGWDDCPTAYQDLDQSQALLRHTTTLFLDSALRAEGDGLDDVSLRGATIKGPSEG